RNDLDCLVRSGIAFDGTPPRRAECRFPVGCLGLRQSPLIHLDCDPAKFTECAGAQANALRPLPHRPRLPFPLAPIEHTLEGVESSSLNCLVATIQAFPFAPGSKIAAAMIQAGAYASRILSVEQQEETWPHVVRPAGHER